MIFSSSAAIYKTSEILEVNELSEIDPLSPYARTKSICESMLEDVANAEPIQILSLRYFNPIGADPHMRSGLQLPHPSHALGRMIDAMETNTRFVITGTDYPTRDGTGIRDYVHVWDLAKAHLLALTKFDEVFTTGTSYEAINLGTGRGTSVKELLNAFNDVAGVSIRANEAPRRFGDVAGAYASRERAEHLLGWAPQHSLVDGIRDSLRWAKIRPDVLGEPHNEVITG
jgi:UDP-glucose 4-epimerase